MTSNPQILMIVSCKYGIQFWTIYCRYIVQLDQRQSAYLTPFPCTTLTTLILANDVNIVYVNYYSYPKIVWAELNIRVFEEFSSSNGTSNFPSDGWFESVVLRQEPMVWQVPQFASENRLNILWLVSCITTFLSSPFWIYNIHVSQN